MTVWKPILARAAVLWLPLAAAITGLSGLGYVIGQQNLRAQADDPQVQMVEDAVARLDAGAPPRSVVPRARVDLAASLDPYLMVFDGSGQPLAGSAALHGRAPEFPSSVFGSVGPGGRDAITWQPERGVRSAVVVERWRGGYVLAGRSLRLTEEREGSLELLAAAGWAGTLALAALAAVLVGFFHPLPNPAPEVRRL